MRHHKSSVLAIKPHLLSIKSGLHIHTHCRGNSTGTHYELLCGVVIGERSNFLGLVVMRHKELPADMGASDKGRYSTVR